MKGKKGSLFILLVLAVAVSSFFAGAVHAGEAKKEHTIMVYMCGSDLESTAGQGSRTIADIVATKFNAEKANVILLLGGTQHWTSGYSSEELTILDMGGRRPRIVGSLPNASMGDPDTFLDFLNYCYENYPAGHFSLFFWNHGGGPIYGVCQDRIFSDMLDMQEVSSALDMSPFREKGLDLIAFHACLMGSAEVAVKMAPYARYMLASQDSMFGLKYDWLSDMDKDPSILETAKRIVDASYAFNKEVIDQRNENLINSMAVVDLDRISAVVDKMDGFFDDVTGDLNDTSFTVMSGQRRNATAFGLGDSGTVSNFDLVDLGNLVSQYSAYDPEAADELMTALSEAVVYQRSQTEECSGLTVYHPFMNKEALEERIAVYNGLGFSTAYTDYIQSFAALLTGTPLADWTDLVMDQGKIRDTRMRFKLKLNEDQMNHYGDASLYVLHKNEEEDGYGFAFMTDETVLDQEGLLSGEYVARTLFAVDENGSCVTDALPYIQNGHSWLVPVSLIRGKDGENEESVRALLSCAMDDEEKVLLPGIIHLWDEEMKAYTSAQEAELTDYDEVLFSADKRIPTRNPDGSLMPFEEWTSTDAAQWRLSTKEDWQLAFVKDALDLTELAAAFQVCDSQNNMYSSELRPVKEKEYVQGESTVTYDDLDVLLISDLQISPVQDSLMLSAAVKSISDEEILIRLVNLVVNGQELPDTAEVYGNGENWGLLKDEEQTLFLPVDISAVSGTDRVDSITFDLEVCSAETEALMTVIPVQVSCNVSLEN